MSKDYTARVEIDFEQAEMIQRYTNEMKDLVKYIRNADGRSMTAASWSWLTGIETRCQEIEQAMGPAISEYLED